MKKAAKGSDDTSGEIRRLFIKFRMLRKKALRLTIEKIHSSLLSSQRTEL
jgi:hypothetical protein